MEFIGRFQGYGALHSIFQLAHVTRPLISTQGFQRFGVNPQDTFSSRRGILFQKMIHQQRNVFPPVSQRRNANGNYAETVVKVFTKGIFGDLPVQIAIGCGDESHIADFRLGRTQSHDLARLQHAQQLRLQR